MPRSLRMVVADADPRGLLCVWGQLETLGHQVIGVATTSNDALALIRKLRPELVLLDTSVLDRDSLELWGELARSGLCPIVLLIRHCEAELLQRASEIPFCAHLLRPVQPRDLERAIGLSCLANQDVGSILREPDAGASTRRTLHEAVGYLVGLHHCPADEALRRIQQEARAKKASLQQVATAILHRQPVPYRYSAPV